LYRYLSVKMVKPGSTMENITKIDFSIYHGDIEIVTGIDFSIYPMDIKNITKIDFSIYPTDLQHTQKNLYHPTDINFSCEICGEHPLKCPGHLL
jgi:hypothetical protein